MKKEGGQKCLHNWHFPPGKHNSFHRTQHVKFHHFSGIIVGTKFCFWEMIPKARPEEGVEGYVLNLCSSKT